MTLRSRLAAGLVTISIILVGPLVFALRSLSQLNDDARELRDRDFAASLLLGRLREGLVDLRQLELGLLFAKNTKARDAMDSQVNHVAALADSLKHFELPAYARDIGRSIIQLADLAPDEYRAALANQAKVADSLSLHHFVPTLNHADSTVLRAERELLNRTTERVANQASAIRRTQTVSGIALVLALILAAAIAYWLTRSISRPIYELRTGMRSVADGDFNYRVRIDPGRSDELGQLAQGFREMTQQLAELDKLKAEFVSVASHELKTPINVMIGYLQLLDEGLYGPVDQKQLEVHQTLVVQANTLLRLVRHLLDVSRFEAGGGRLEPRTVRIDNLLADLERAFHVLAVQREIAFRVQRCDGLPDEVFWDLDRINEVIGNLLSNAFKFTPHGGTVELTVDPVESGIRMRVRDTGAGIPPDQVHRIFDKFYQADNQAEARSAGTGLGLAIAKQIVEAHGGSITCESTLGAGTTFTLCLPTRVARRPPARRQFAARMGA
jgi:signal transduction histidine kinase